MEGLPLLLTLFLLQIIHLMTVITFQDRSSSVSVSLLESLLSFLILFLLSEDELIQSTYWVLWYLLIIKAAYSNKSPFGFIAGIPFFMRSSNTKSYASSIPLFLIACYPFLKSFSLSTFSSSVCRSFSLSISSLSFKNLSSFSFYFASAPYIIIAEFIYY